MYQLKHPIHEFHFRTYGPVSEFGYKELVRLFTAKHFDTEISISIYYFLLNIDYWI